MATIKEIQKDFFEYLINKDPMWQPVLSGLNNTKFYKLLSTIRENDTALLVYPDIENEINFFMDGLKLAVYSMPIIKNKTNTKLLSNIQSHLHLATYAELLEMIEIALENPNLLEDNKIFAMMRLLEEVSLNLDYKEIIQLRKEISQEEMKRKRIINQNALFEWKGVSEED